MPGDTLAMRDGMLFAQWEAARRSHTWCTLRRLRMTRRSRNSAGNGPTLYMAAAADEADASIAKQLGAAGRPSAELFRARRQPRQLARQPLLGLRTGVADRGTSDLRVLQLCAGFRGSRVAPDARAVAPDRRAGGVSARGSPDLGIAIGSPRSSQRHGSGEEQEDVVRRRLARPVPARHQRVPADHARGGGRARASASG